MNLGQNFKECRASSSVRTSPLQIFCENMAKAAKRKNVPKRYISGTESENQTEILVTNGYFAGEKRKVCSSNERMGAHLTNNQTTISYNLDGNAQDIINTTLSETSGLQKKGKQSTSLRMTGINASSTHDEHQMILDAGQRDLGKVYQCSVCMMVYVKSSPDDAAMHERFHFQILNGLKFPGWKKERLVEQGPCYRIICVEPTDPSHCIKKVQSLKVILDQELGYVHETALLTSNRKVYLYISDDKQIEGICIAEPITHGFPYSDSGIAGTRLPAQIGINRIWVYGNSRRKRIATNLLDIIRSTFLMGVCVPRSRIAYSDSSTHGSGFAAKYGQTKGFLIYKP